MTISEETYISCNDLTFKKDKIESINLYSGTSISREEITRIKSNLLFLRLSLIWLVPIYELTFTLSNNNVIISQVSKRAFNKTREDLKIISPSKDSNMFKIEEIEYNSSLYRLKQLKRDIFSEKKIIYFPIIWLFFIGTILLVFAVLALSIANFPPELLLIISLFGSFYVLLYSIFEFSRLKTNEVALKNYFKFKVTIYNKNKFFLLSILSQIFFVGNIIFLFLKY